LGNQINITTQGDVNFSKDQVKETIVKEDSSPNENESDSTKIATVIIPIIATIIIPLLIYFLSRPEEEPIFTIVNSILKSDATLIIKADNKKANKKKSLNIIFDGCSFPKKGISVAPDSDGMYQWHFKLKNHAKVDRLTKDGEHKVKFSFPGGKFSNEFKIIFNSKPPIVRVEKINKSGQTIVKGEVTTELQLPKKLLCVYVTYFHKGQEYKIPDIPLTTKVHEETGITYFEFETALQGLPTLDKNDPNFSAPFWSLEVVDQAGNKYFYEQSYAKFMAPGNDKFGVGDIANVKVVKLSKDVANKLTNIKSTIRIIPKTIIERLPEGKPPIELKVRSIGNNAAKLEWNYNITSIAPLTLVYKEDKKIGVSATTEFIDYSVNRSTKYRVEQETEETIYKSRETKLIDPSLSERFIASDALEKNSDDGVRNTVRKYFKSINDRTTYKETITLESGWNLISLPIIPDNTKISTIFPGIELAYSSKEQNQILKRYPPLPLPSSLKNYNKVVHINPGKAYFVYSKITNQYILTGKEFSYFSLELHKGWSLIGCINKTVTPTTNPENSIDAIYFYYKERYIAADKFEKGKGYWIKTKQQCELILGSRNIFKRSNLSEKIVDQNGSYTDTEELTSETSQFSWTIFIVIISLSIYSIYNIYTILIRNEQEPKTHIFKHSMSDILDSLERVIENCSKLIAKAQRHEMSKNL